MILTINAGSSSLKAKLFSKDLILIKEFSYTSLKDIAQYRAALIEINKDLSQSIQKPQYIAHRIVLGGPGAKNGEVADEEVIRRIRRHSSLAPLHNQRAISIIRLCQKIFGRILNVVVYDSVFFEKLPEEEYTYPIDKNVSERLSIRKYGFHGLSHEAMAKVYASKYNKIITIHLGAGCSISAIQNGRPIATSMGMTPQAGLMMQSRSGDIDPGVIFLIAEKYGLSRTKKIISEQSGLKGVSGTDGSMLTILHLSGNPISGVKYEYKGPNNQYLRHQAHLALEIYCQRVKDYIGAYAARMGGLEAIIFSGNIGYGSKFIRDKITYGLDYLNLKEVTAIKTDEEMQMSTIVRDKFFNNQS